MRFSLLVVWVAGFGAATAAAQPLTQAEVEEAMAVLRADLYAMQDPETGGWYGVYDKSPVLNDPKNDELLTVTATLALLRSGDSPDVEPRLAKAVERVAWGEERDAEVVSTQVVGTRAQIWPLLPGDDHEDRLERDGERLLRAASEAATFEALLTERADAENWNHRMTQYAVAGIAEAQDAGLKVPDRFWERAAGHFLRVQAASGGWSYSPTSEPNAAMTCAGLSVLLTARAEVRAFREADRPEPELEAAIARGLAYLDGELSGDKTVYGGSGYLFYGLEEVALRTGRRRLGDTEWFQEMGRYIVDRALAGGDSVHGQVVNASWFLMFLARGEVPLAFNKLTLGAEDGPSGEGRPNDVHALTAWLSDTFEGELNWQRVALDAPVEGLLSTPVSLLMLGGAWSPTPAERERVETFLGLGGLLVVVPVGRSAAEVKASVEGLLTGLYPPEPGRPAVALEPVADDHPVLGLWRAPRKAPRFYAAGNGARTLVLLAGEDLGRDWQRGRKADDARVVGANLHLFASGYGELPPRVASAFPRDPADPGEPASKGEAPPPVVVAVVRCGALAGREPRLWEATRRRLLAEGVASVDVRGVEEAAFPGEGLLDGVDLLHLVGLDAAAPAPEVVAAAAAFARSGGSVFVEALGGRGGFADAAGAALAAELGAAVGPLPPGTGFLAADPTVPGTADLSRVVFRPYSIQRFDAGTEPVFSAVTLGGRAAVVLSPEDVSLGALGVRQWGIRGHGLPDAGRLARNLVLHAAAERAAGAGR